MINPRPQVAVSEQIHTKQSNQIRQVPAETGAELKKLQDQHRDQGGPDLDLQGIGAGAHEGFNLEVLFQGSEKQLDLPAIFVDRGQRRCSPLKMIAQQHPELAGLRMRDLNAAILLGRPKMELGIGPIHHLVFENPAVLRDRAFFDNDALSIGSHARHKKDSRLAPPMKEMVIGESLVDD